MTIPLAANVLADHIAVSLAGAIAVANQRASDLGVDAQSSLITIAQIPANGGLLWRINYGPKDYVGHRGGI